jgi:hypothetical protein
MATLIEIQSEPMGPDGRGLVTFRPISAKVPRSQMHPSSKPLNVRKNDLLLRSDRGFPVLRVGSMLRYRHKIGFLEKLTESVNY